MQQFCGVCHTDLHNAADHLTALGGTKYPIVPGHELAGGAWWGACLFLCFVLC